MHGSLTPQVSAGIVKKAQSFPGVLSGIARLEALQTSPSYQAYQGMSWKTSAAHETKDTIKWPDGARSVLVLAMRHPRRQPALDWWDGKNTEGNRALIQIGNRLETWLSEKLGATVVPLPYHIESGGVFLKDAAVLAGLGIVGKNNLLITPELGPRVRLRGMLLDLELVPTGPIDWFTPCADCRRPCQQKCPQQAFADGTYDRERCMVQMEKDRANAETKESPETPEARQTVVKYCRACEINCPVGSWEE